MLKSREIPWPRIFAEGVAIVVSILLAFGIEAWWSDRQERAAEKELLSSIRSELAELHQVVDGRITYIKGIREAGRQILRATTVEDHGLSDQRIDELLYQIWFHEEVAALSTPVMISAISSGEIGLILSSDVRRQIASWPEHLGRTQNNMQREINFYAERLMPFLIQQAALSQVIMADTHTPGFPNEIYDDDFPIVFNESESHLQLLESREFQNLLIERDNILTGILGLGYSVLSEEIVVTLEMLDAEIPD